MARRRKRRSFGSVTRRRGRSAWVVRWEWKGREVQRAVGTDFDEAEKRLAAVEALLKNGRSVDDVLATVFGEFHGPTASLDDVADRFLASRRKADRESTQEADALRMAVLRRAPWAKKPLGKVTVPELLAWQTVREADVENATLNRERTLLSRVFVWSAKQGWVPDGFNPARKLDERHEEEREPCYLTADECRMVLGVTEDPEARALFMAAIRTGARRGELLALTWSDIDPEQGRIRFRGATAKGKRVRYVHVGKDVFRELNCLRIGRPRIPQGAAPVFTNRRGEAFKKGTVRSKLLTLKRRLRALNTDAGTEAISAEKIDRLRFHDLRHTCASLLVAAGVPIFDVSKVLGHAQIQITLRYAHFAPDAGKAAAAAMDATFKTA